MKTTIKTALAAVMLLTFSCKKESPIIQSSSTSNESVTQNLLSDANLNGDFAVRIGSQVWKTKDLGTSHYRNGDRIPQVQDPTEWESLTTGAWCWYQKNYTISKLYNWYAVNDPRGLAPEGWHVPTDSEWTRLIVYLGGQDSAGGKMKSVQQVGSDGGDWWPPNTGATNSSGWSGNPGGFRDWYGSYDERHQAGYWWSSSESNVVVSLGRSSAGVWAYSWPRYFGCCVRCIKD